MVTTQMFNVDELSGVWGLYRQSSRSPCCQDEQEFISDSHKIIVYYNDTFLKKERERERERRGQWQENSRHV